MTNIPYLYDNEARNLLNVVDEIEIKTAFMLGLDLGCRVGEIITIPNLEEFTTEILILDSKAQNEVKKKGKTKRSPYRNCVITKATLSQIKMFQNYLRDIKDKRKFLFPYSERTINRWIKFYCDKAGIKRDSNNLIRWHMFRHTYVQNCINKKVEMKKVSQQTGDSIFTLIKYYNTYSLEDRQKTAEETSLV